MSVYLSFLVLRIIIINVLIMLENKFDANIELHKSRYDYENTVTFPRHFLSCFTT